MKILIFSDLHAHSFKPYSKTLSNGRNSRLQDSLNVLEEIYQYCISYKIDGVLFGGDLFHIRTPITVSTFNPVHEGIAKIKTAVKFMGLLVGNHDQYNKAGNIHSIDTFNSMVTILDRPGWAMFKAEEEEI